MTITAVLFDLDGTLIDSLPLIKYSFQRVFEEMKIPWEDGRVMETVGLPLREVAHLYAGEQTRRFIELYQKHQMEKHDQLIKPFAGTVSMLQQVRSLGMKTGIVTSKRRIMAKRAVELVSFSSMMELMIALEDCEKHKPDPLPVKMALQGLGVLPEETVFVGDSWYDVIAGKGAGVLTVGVTWGMANRSQLTAYQPDLVVEQWEELIDFIQDKRSNAMALG